ncbi:HD domain-containing phosphohydrolase [Enterovirga sp.]|uniref:HD domain-containing phosphohydrolase n=1 Tax=Enterovirga sp. TaxID=2026350 RepID=UPI00260D9734|nr:HD domain-containing phosphohydrolase [Enterovirga sp.]
MRRLVLLSVGAALLLNAGLGLFHEAHRYLDSKRNTLLAAAQAFAAAAGPGLAAGSEVTVTQAIRAIARVPTVVYAEVQDRAGRRIAQLGGAVRLAGDLDLSDREAGSVLKLLKSRTAQVAVPVIDSGEQIGRLILVADVSDLDATLWRTLLPTALGSALAASIGLLISVRLQASITEPLAELGRTMSRIGQTHDYQGSVQVRRDDEVGALARTFNVMIGEIRRATAAIEQREQEVILRLSRATEKRDGDTGDHIMRMATLCRVTAEGMGLDRHVVDNIHRAAPLHDIGKVGVSDAIMFKNGPLDPEERRAMEKHAEHGYEVLRDSDSELIQLAAEIALSHHERWDGAGYPRRLKGEQIPLSGRIAAVADVSDALASKRAYKKGWTLDEVRSFLLANAGTQFDPDCVQALVSRWPDVEALYGPSRAAMSPEPAAA